jgi:hypothetical protein
MQKVIILKKKNSFFNFLIIDEFCQTKPGNQEFCQT